MGQQRLIEALRRNEEARVRQIWQQVEEQASALEIEIAERLANGHQAGQERVDPLATDQAAALQRGAEDRSRAILTAAKTALAEALWEQARDALPALREGDYPSLFAALADELPTRPWQRVWVKPQDLELAQRHFPGVDIIPADTLGGGMIVAAENDSIRIDNSFEKRLERAWIDLLPQLVAAVMEEHCAI